MLPDFPETRAQIASRLMQWLKDSKRAYLGPFGDMKFKSQFEGDTQSIQQEGGNIVKTEFGELGTSLDVSGDNIEQLTVNDIKSKIDGAAQELARQQSELMIKEFERATVSSGNSVDAGGKPLDIDMFLQLLEKVGIDFDDDNKPIMPMLIVGTNLTNQIDRLIQDAESDPKSKRRFDDLINKKWREHRDREASRKLVG